MTNKVELEGTVASEVKFRLLPTGTALTSFRIEVPKLKGAGADWFTVVCWQQLAEQVANQYKEGESVKVIGRLTSRKFEIEGQPRSVVEVTAEVITGGSGSSLELPSWEA